MIAPLPPLEIGREFHPMEGVVIMTEQAIDARITSVGFSAVHYEAWAEERELEPTPTVPLRLCIRDRYDVERADTDNSPITVGNFQNAGHEHGIDLYIGHLLSWYDTNAPEFGSQVCEAKANAVINETLKHELEHRAQTLKDGPIVSLEEQLIIQGLQALAKSWSEQPPASDTRCTQEISRLLLESRAAIGHQAYLDQPHEIKARQAAENPTPILTLGFKPVDG